jgi:hypothetical protein
MKRGADERASRMTPQDSLDGEDEEDLA